MMLFLRRKMALLLYPPNQSFLEDLNLVHIFLVAYILPLDLSQCSHCLHHLHFCELVDSMVLSVLPASIIQFRVLHHQVSQPLISRNGLQKTLIFFQLVLTEHLSHLPQISLIHPIRRLLSVGIGTGDIPPNRLIEGEGGGRSSCNEQDQREVVYIHALLLLIYISLTQIEEYPSRAEIRKPICSVSTIIYQYRSMKNCIPTPAPTHTRKLLSYLALMRSLASNWTILFSSAYSYSLIC